MTDTAQERLIDALPANPAYDGPIGVDSTDLRAQLAGNHTPQQPSEMPPVVHTWIDNEDGG